MKNNTHKFLIVILLATYSSGIAFSYSETPNKNIKPLAGSDYYWIGDGGDYRDLSHWSSISGGTADKVTLPGFEDNIYFDENSFSLPGQIVTIQDMDDALGAEFKSMDWTGVTNTPTFRIRKVTSVWLTSRTVGSLIFDQNMILDFLGAEFEFSGDGNYVIDTKGHYLGDDNWMAINYSFGLEGTGNGTGTADIVSDMNADFLYMQSGILNTNGYAISAPGYFYVNGAEPKTLNLGTSTITTGNLLFPNQSAVATLAGSYKFLIGEGGGSFGGINADGMYFNEVEIGPGKSQPNGSIAYGILRLLPGAHLVVRGGSTHTFGQLIAMGTKKDPITIEKRIETPPANFVQLSGVVEGDWLILKDNVASGGATFNAIHSVNLGNVSGWNLCEVPTGLYVNPTELTSNSAILRWDNVDPTVGYEVNWKATSAAAPIESFTIPAGITALSIGSLIPGQQYKFKVKSSCNFSGTPEGSAFSDWLYFTTTTPGCQTPTGPGVSDIFNTEATLSWDAVSDVATYEVEYKPSLAGLPFISVLTGTDEFLDLEFLTPGQQYKFKVKALCTIDGTPVETEFTSEIYFTTLTTGCTTPVGIYADGVDNTSATLHWLAVSDESTYEVEYKPTSAGQPYINVSTGTNEFLLLDDVLTPGQQYKYRVRALCNLSGTTVVTDFSADFYFTTTAAGCAVPSNIIVGVVDNTSAPITWDNVADGQQYEIMYKPTIGGVPYTTVTESTNSTTLDFLSPGQQYKFQIRAICDISGNIIESAYSGLIYFTTTSSCLVPAGLPATSVTSSSAVLNWTNVNPGEDYEILYKPTISGQPFQSILVSNTGSTPVGGLLSNQKYKFKVRSICDPGGTTSFSSFVFFTTDPGSTVMQSGNKTRVDEIEEVEVKIEQSYKVFPNPSTDYVTVRFIAEEKGIGSLTIYSLNGSQISQRAFEDRLETTINLKQHGGGMYVARIIFNDMVYEEKIIVK